MIAFAPLGLRDLPQPKRLQTPFDAGVAGAWLVRASPRVLDYADMALSDDELQRLEAFGDERRALTFATGRLWLRTLLAQRFGISPSSVALAIAETGRPHLRDSEELGIDFNLSNTRDLVLIGIGSGGKIGVDIQAWDERIDHEAAATVAFSPEERALFSRSKDRACTFYALWTQKESLLKALGCGLGEDPRAVTIPSLSPPRGGEFAIADCRELNLGPLTATTASLTVISR